MLLSSPPRGSDAPVGWTAVRVVKNHMEWHRMPETEENMTNQKGHGQVAETETESKRRGEGGSPEMGLDGRSAEEAHLAECLKVIKANIAVYEEEVKLWYHIS